MFVDAINSSSSRFPKFISPAAHGVIDYCHAAFFFTVGMLCSQSNKRAAVAAVATGSFILVQSMLTDYRFGIKPVIPFSTHGKMDRVFAASSWMIPMVFGFRGTKAARIFESNSFAESTVVAATDWSSDREQARAA
jgi:hypothetical protein